MSISLNGPSAVPFGYKLSSPAGISAVQSIHSAQGAAVQTLNIAASDAVRSVKAAEDASHLFFPSAGGDQHQLSVPTDLSTLVKGG